MDSELIFPLAGGDHKVFVCSSVTSTEDLFVVENFLRESAVMGPVCVDTETTGLDPFAPSFKLRTVQFGCNGMVLVIKIVDGYSFDAVRHVFGRLPSFVMHNAAFDILALHTQVGLCLDELWQRVTDTRIMAHLLNSSPKSSYTGSPGLKLEDLSHHYFAWDAHRYQTELLALFKARGWSKADGYRLIDVDDPVFIRYAAADVVLGSMLWDTLHPLVSRFNDLLRFEHDVARIVSLFQAKGVRVDVDYAYKLSRYFSSIEREADVVLRSFGVTKVNSTDQVARALTALGAELIETTKTGKPKVDKLALNSVVEHGPDAAGKLANAVMVAKNADKWRVAYVDSVLSRLDSDDRVHASINALQARTSRMSISSPPLHQLPSNDWRVRRMFVPSDGCSMFAVDYKQVELRILAALAREPTMLSAIALGRDLHDTTAERLFGEGFSKRERRLAKNTNFGEVFGGGVKTLAMQAGVSLDESRWAKDQFNKSFPVIKRYAKTLQRRARKDDFRISTPSGRRIPLDRDRVYAATNYVVQSTARDVLGQALVDLDKAGLSDYVLLPIHDEVLGEAELGDVESVMLDVMDVMKMDFLDRVTLDVDGEVFGPSWGHGYLSDGENAILEFNDSLVDPSDGSEIEGQLALF